MKHSKNIQLYNIFSFDLDYGLGEKNIKLVGQFNTTYKKCLYEAKKLGFKSEDIGYTFKIVKDR